MGAGARPPPGEVVCQRRANDAWKDRVLAPGVGLDGDILFSNLIVVFQLQKEMRKGVCVRE